MGYVPHRDRPAQYREDKKRQNRVRRWKRREALRADAGVSDEELDRRALALKPRLERPRVCPLCRRALRILSNGVLSHLPGEGRPCDLKFERQYARRHHEA